jgi:hypothetical protein
MAGIAMDEAVEIGIRPQLYKELAQYVAPKRWRWQEKIVGPLCLRSGAQTEGISQLYKLFCISNLDVKM